MADSCSTPSIYCMAFFSGHLKAFLTISTLSHAEHICTYIRKIAFKAKNDPLCTRIFLKFCVQQIELLEFSRNSQKHFGMSVNCMQGTGKCAFSLCFTCI